MINEPIKITPPRLAQAAVSPEEPHTSIFPTIGRYKPEVSIFDDFDIDRNSLTYRLEETIHVLYDKILNAEEDLIAGALIDAGWTPPPGSRWSSCETIPEKLDGKA